MYWDIFKRCLAEQPIGQACAALHSMCSDHHLSFHAFLNLEVLAVSHKTHSMQGRFFKSSWVGCRFAHPLLPAPWSLPFCVKLTARATLTVETQSASPLDPLEPSQSSPKQQTPSTTLSTSRFHQTHGRFPGSYDDTVEDDVAMLKAAAGQVLGELGASGAAVQDDLVGEMCRWVVVAHFFNMWKGCCVQTCLK